MADSDVTFGRALCPAKGLLSKWSSSRLNDQPLKERGLDLFVTYFERFLFTADDFSVPSMLAAAELKRGGDTKAKSVLLQLYRSNAPLDEPAFFSFFDHTDLARLSLVVDREAVIFFELSCDSAADPKFLPYYDTRSSSCCSAAASKEIDYFLLKPNRSLLSISADTASEVFDLSCASFLRKRFSSSIHPLVDSFNDPNFDWARMVRPLLDLSVASHPSSSSSVADVAIRSQGLFQGRHQVLWELWGRRCLVVSLEGVNGKIVKRKSGAEIRRLILAKDISSIWTVHTLTLVRPPGETFNEALAQTPVVICFFSGRFAMRFSNERAEVLVDAIRSCRMTSLNQNSSPLPLSSHPLLKDSALPKATKVERETAFSLFKQRRDEKRCKSRLPPKTKMCRCSDLCGLSDFDANMASDGPERLMTKRFCARDLVEMLGALVMPTMTWTFLLRPPICVLPLWI